MKRLTVQRLAMCSLVLLVLVLLGAPQATASPAEEGAPSPDGWWEEVPCWDQALQWVARTLGLDGASGSGDLGGGDGLELFGTEPAATSQATTTEEEGDRAAGVDPNGHTTE